MPACHECHEECDNLTTVKSDGRRIKVCPDCAEQLESDEQIAAQSESVVQQMMGFSGRRSG